MWKKSLSAMLFSLFLFFTVRFGVEFFRDHSVSSFSTAYYWGVWSCQWGMLGLVLILGGFLWFYEKGMKTKTTKGLQNKPYIQAEFTYIIIISFFVYTFNNLLLPYEFMVVWIMFIPAILLSFYYLFTENRLSNHRQLICIFLLTPFYVLAQTIPDQTPEIKQYKRIDVGGSFGNFANQVAFNPQQTSNECGTTTSYDYNTFKQVYEMGGVGFSQVTIKNNNTLRYGINLSGGTVKSTDLETNDTQSEFIYAANPFVKWDGKWFGIGTGFQLGKLRVNKYETLDISNIDDAQKNYNLLPEFYMRVGQKKYVDIDYNYGFMIPSAYPTLYSRSSIGSGFGLSQDYSLRYGQIWNLETGYIAAEGLLNNNLGVNIMYVFKENNFQFQENEASGKFILSLNYRFGHKTK
jgi:phosphatidylglycerol:prolipoprotein diacylglycerol transferase